MTEPVEIRMEMVLDSGKTVRMRPLTVGLRRKAVMMASKISGGDQTVVQFNTQGEMLKLLVTDVDGKPVDKSAMEVDGFFSIEEDSQLMLVVADMAGTNVKKPSVKMITL